MMHAFEVFQLYNLFVGGLSAVGFLYLLTHNRSFGSYRRFVYILVLGILIFALGGPLVDIVAPAWSHAVHVVSALFVIYGLYNPIHNDLRREEWADLILTDPRLIRSSPTWMAPMDDVILELFHNTDLVLTPSIIAYNTGYSREAVNRRLGDLTDRGFMERVERGKYRITEFGRRYLTGKTVEGTREDAETVDETAEEGEHDESH